MTASRSFSNILIQVVLLSAALSFVATSENSTSQGTKYEAPIIGIDLGTTYSVVGVWSQDGVEIIPNELGNRITPSVVAFSEQERLVGDAARNQMERNHANTVYAVKRLIGRRKEDETVQKDIPILSYEVGADNHGRAEVRVNFRGHKKSFKPEEISAMILLHMKEIAETYLSQKVVNAVITVPAYFNDAQRKATKDAGTIAGLNVVRVLNEPTAAAIAYGLDRAHAEKKVLVFDLGGGTFDVSLLNIDQGFFEVKATNGDTHLGGEDFDNRVITYLSTQFTKKSGIDISKNQLALARLRKAAESAKRRLSSLPEVIVEVDSVVDGVPLSEKLSRAKFEELCMDLFRSTLEPVKAVLQDAELEKEDIDEIVLVGGSTRIPKIQSLLKEFFNGKQPNRGINPDEAVAYGAAVQGGLLSGASELSGKVLLVDVLPLSIGIETMGGVFLPVLPRNTIIPSSKQTSVTTTTDNQTHILFQVYEGERAMTRDNRLLGKFDLQGIQPAPRGVPSVEVQMDVDENGILHVRATDKASGSSEAISITNDENRLSPEEIERMVSEAALFADEDKETREITTARVMLEQYVYEVKGKASDGGELENAFSSQDERQKVLNFVNEVVNWLDKVKEASNDDEDAEGQSSVTNYSAEDYQSKLKTLQEEIGSLFEDAKTKHREKSVASAASEEVSQIDSEDENDADSSVSDDAEDNDDEYDHEEF